MGAQAKAGKGRWTWWVGLGLLAVYMAWMLGPYFRSVLVRDAAVTTWINVATSPIYGTVDAELPALGSRVGADGRIIGVRNERIDSARLDQAEAEVIRSETALVHLRDRVAELRRLERERLDRRQHNAATLLRSLAIEVDGARAELAFIEQRLALVRSQAERKEELARRGTTAMAERDVAMAEVAALELRRVEQENRIAQARLRYEEIEQGRYLLADGSDPDWADRGMDAVRLELGRAEAEVRAAEAALGKARADVVAERARVQRDSAAAVQAPPGSVIWSMIVGAGATVDIGSPVAQWIDCSRLLIDVPAADVEIALLRKGMPAEVVLEGESRTRQAEVVLTRGAASTLGPVDLAAIAKGRRPGIGQVLLALPATAGDVEACPVGTAAYVDFPDVGLIDVLRGRLRL